MVKQIEQLNKEIKELKEHAKENQKRSVSTLINAINEKSTLGLHNYAIPQDSEYDIYYQGDPHLNHPLQGLYHQVNQSAVKLPGGPYMSNQQFLPSSSSLNDNQINSERLQVSSFDISNNTARKTTMFTKQSLQNNTFYKQMQGNLHMKSPYINGSKVTVKGGKDQSVTIDLNRAKLSNEGKGCQQKRTKSSCKLITQ